MSGGDYKLEDSVYILFTTRAFATGIPGVLSAATVAVYEDVTATPIETSIAVTETLNSINGLNAVTIAALAASGYNAGGHYHVVIEAGTVDSVSVVGEVVGSFTIATGAALKLLGSPAGASVSSDLLTIDSVVDAILTDTAEIGVNGAGLTDLATASALSTAQTDLNTLTGTDGVTLATAQANYAPALASVCSETRLSELDAATAGKVANDTALILADTGTAGVVIAAGQTVATVTTLTGHTAQTGDSFARLGAPAGVSVSADILVIQTDTTTDIPALIGTPAVDLAADIAAAKVDTAAILVDTAVIGALGAGLTALSTQASVDLIQTDTTAILADTNELQVDWVNGGRLDLILDAILLDTAEIGTAGAGLTNLGGTLTELTGVPADDVNMATMIGWLYIKARNKVTQTATTQLILADDGTTTVGTSTVSDDATTATRGEYV